MKPADCRSGQRVLHAGRAHVVSAILGDRATITDGNGFRVVPLAELEPALQDGQIEFAIRNLGKDAEPEPNWQQRVWQRLAGGGEPESRPSLLVAVGIIVIGAAVGVAVGLLIAWVA